MHRTLRFAGSIPLDDLQLMREAIEQDGERVDVDEAIAIMKIVLTDVAI